MDCTISREEKKRKGSNTVKSINKTKNQNLEYNREYDLLVKYKKRQKVLVSKNIHLTDKGIHSNEYRFLERKIRNLSNNLNF
tara:strand:+ start:620 stop:865 length:246 start_codon:yes stop_codon:yes gene_type:complete